MPMVDVSRVDYNNIDEVRRILSGLLLIILKVEPPFVDAATKQVTFDDLKMAPAAHCGRIS